MKLNLERSGPFIGVAGMASTFFLYAWSAVAIRDLVTIVVLPLLWLVLLVLTLSWFTRHPYLAMLPPLVATGVWFAVLLT